jgi:hypothetical protein
MPYRNRLIIFSFLLFCSVQLFAQKKDMDITGLWKGTMYNDSTQKFLRYEIAISQNEKGKLSGFTHTFFISDDKEYHGVKKVKVKKQDGKIIIEDQELIVNNYPIPPAKNVRQLDVLTLEVHDSVMILSGPFSTNRTKQYASLTGTINVQRKHDFKQSALIPHLEELGLASELSFADEIKKSETNTETKPAAVTEQPVVKSTPVKEQPVIKITPIVKEKPAEEKPVVKSAPVEKEKTVTTQPVAKTTPVTKEKEQPAVVKQPETVAAKKPEEKPAAPSAVDLAKRTIETIQSVYFKSDSLVLTLYDNGEVDGDTVSVIMNGKVIMPRVGLTTNAVRKTIYTQDIGDSIQIIMYAETLGSLPPNTGLLIVNDGTDRYEIRFSGDMERSSAIMFRRKSPL